MVLAFGAGERAKQAEAVAAALKDPDERIELGKIKDAERARFDVENERGMIEETRVAEKRKFDAALARLEAEKTDALAKGRTWELFTYIATGGLIALLIILGSVLLAKRRRSTPPQQESKSKTTSLGREPSMWTLARRPA